MKNIRLYLGGQRVDLDESVKIPFTFQTSDAEMPTAVKNSYSKTVSLKGTERNRKIFGGLWRLDSLVQDPRPTPPPRFVADASESDAEFTYRATPVLASGDALKVTKVLGDTVVWNQLIDNGNFASTSGWTRYSSYAPFTVSDNTATMTVTTATRNATIYTSVAFPDGHKIYYSYRLKITAQTARTIYTSYVYPSPYQYEPATPVSTDGFSSWHRASGIITASGDKNRLYVGVYGNSSADTLAVGDTVEIQSVMAVDLTTMFGSTIANSMTAADFEALYPLDYYDYNAGQLVSNGASALETRDAGNGVLGSFPLDVTDLVPDALPTVRLNQHILQTTYNYTVNFVTLSRDTTGIYTINGTASAATNFSLDAPTHIDARIPQNNKALYWFRMLSGSYTGTINVGAGTGGTTTLAANSAVIAVRTNGTNFPYISIANGAVATSVRIQVECIDLTVMYGAGNEPTSAAEVEELIGTAFIPPTTGTDIANKIFPVGLKGIGTAYDEASTNAVKRIGVVDLGTLNWSVSTSGGAQFFRVVDNDVKAPTSGAERITGILSAVYPPDTVTAIDSTSTDKAMHRYASGGNTYLYIRDTSYSTADAFKVSVSGVYLYYELATPVTYTLAAPLSDEPVPSDPSGYQVRIPEDTAGSVLAPFRADFEYGRMIPYPEDDGVYFDPMKRVDFLLYIDEMIVERGYCQLTAINRTGRNYTFSLSLYGGLGEFFYNLQSDADGETKSLADLDFGSDLSFRISAPYVQQVWDDLIANNLPTIAFVPMHNGVPKQIDAKKVLISGGGIPATVTDGGTTYGAKSGYLLGTCEKKYTEWQINDLRSYLQRPALRVKDFIAACCASMNNGGWTVNLDSDFFVNTNPYYEKTYILLPQLNVEEETEDICDDGEFTPFSDYPSTVTRTTSIGITTAGCLTIVSDEVDMSAYASNAYLKVSAPVQLAVRGLADQGPLFLTNRVSHHTENKTICMMLAAWDDDGNLLAVSNRYVFTSKSHRLETADVKKPAAPYSTTDAQIDGYFEYSNGEYIFRSDDSPSNTYALTIDKIARPNSALRRVRVDFLLQMTAQGIPTLNTTRIGYNSFNVYVNNTQFQARLISGANNSVSVIAPTQYASDALVSQTALLNSLEESPLDLLLSYTKTFGLMWYQDNLEKSVSLFKRENYYTGKVVDIHNLVDYSKGIKITPVAAESNNYTLENEYPETTLSAAYESDYGRTYGGVRLKVGYDFGKDKVETMEKVKLKGYIEGALTGSGYWTYSNSGGALPSPIADGLKVTYYHDSGGTTDTKDVEYNLFTVASLQKLNSPALGVACKSDDGEEKNVEVAPALVMLQGGQMSGNYFLSDDIPAMEILNNSPCWIWDNSRTAARIPKFARVATFGGETYSLDFGTPKETYYIPDVSLAPEQAIYARFWQDYLGDLLSRDTKVVECYIVFPPHLDMRKEMRNFYLFDRSLWVLNKVTDYDATKEQPVKCEFIRVMLKSSYTDNL